MKKAKKKIKKYNRRITWERNPKTKVHSPKKGKKTYSRKKVKKVELKNDY